MLQLILAIISLILIVVFLWLTFRLHRQLFPEFHMYRRVSAYVRNYLYAEHYHLVENVCITNAKGDEIVIPQVVVSRFGVFILAFCPARHVILGNHSITWWYSRKGNWYYPFDNPHMQIEPARDALESFIQHKKTICKSMVIFQEQAKFSKTDNARTGHLQRIFREVTDTRLCYLDDAEYIDLINKLENTRERITSAAKQGIIVTGVIEPTPVT